MAIEVAARTAEKFLDRKGYEVLGLAGEPEDWCLIARDGRAAADGAPVDGVACETRHARRKNSLRHFGHCRLGWAGFFARYHTDVFCLG